MAQATELFGEPTFTVDQTGGVVANRRVKLKTGTTVEYAGDAEKGIGFTRRDAKDTEEVAVRLWASEGVFMVEVEEDHLDLADLYGGANGLMKDTSSGAILMTALEANAEGSGSVVRAIPV